MYRGFASLLRAAVVATASPQPVKAARYSLQVRYKSTGGTDGSPGDYGDDGPSSSGGDGGPTGAVEGGSLWDTKQRGEELRAQYRKRGSERLSNLFGEDAARTSWHHRPGSELPAGEFGGRVTTIRSAPPEEGEEGHGILSAPHSQWPEAQPQSQRQLQRGVGAALRSRFSVDEDEAEAEAALSTQLATVEALEQDLLDDDFLYFPPASQQTGGAVRVGVEASPEAEREPTVAAEAQRYIPGQQIIPPGMTRYRVDVQYQGSDFDGWHKSTAKQYFKRVLQPDGTVRRVPLPEPSMSAGVAQDSMSTRYHARTVLEEALAVALDVPTVQVVASVIPEGGVSVRRLVCHVDLPSDVEMQPRTILQRATMWLQKRQQPLAILSCHRCHNQDFHARHSGVRRLYCYRILNRVAPPLFDAGLQWHVDRHLDVPRMQRFAAAMEGTKDFGYFADPKMANALRRAARSSPGASASSAYMQEHAQPTVSGLRRGEKPTAPKEVISRGLTNLERAAALPTFNEYGQRVVSYSAKPHEYHKSRTNMPTIRTIDRIEVVRQEDEVLIWFVGQSFLRHQIRNMVSVLKASGHGLWDELELQHAFNAGFEVSRKKFLRERLPAAPAYGLTLWDVEYPEHHRDDFVAFVDSGPYEEMDISRIN